MTACKLLFSLGILFLATAYTPAFATTGTVSVQTGISASHSFDASSTARPKKKVKKKKKKGKHGCEAYH